MHPRSLGFKPTFSETYMGPTCQRATSSSLPLSPPLPSSTSSSLSSGKWQSRPAGGGRGRRSDAGKEDVRRLATWRRVKRRLRLRRGRSGGGAAPRGARAGEERRGTQAGEEQRGAACRRGRSGGGDACPRRRLSRRWRLRAGIGSPSPSVLFSSTVAA